MLSHIKKFVNTKFRKNIKMGLSGDFGGNLFAFCNTIFLNILIFITEYNTINVIVIYQGDVQI